METAEKIMTEIGEKRKREHYKQKYLNARGVCVVMFGVICFLMGITLYSFKIVHQMQKQIADRPMVIMPNGDTK